MATIKSRSCLVLFLVIFIASGFAGCNKRKEEAPDPPPAPPVAAENLAEKLQRKLTELKDLHGKLTEKSRQISDLINEYESGIRTNSEEIRLERGSQHINSFQQAVGNQRIQLSLSSMQRRLAYVQKLQEISARVQSGCNEIGYLESQASDDLHMTTVLDTKESQDIMAKLIHVIEKYEPESGKLILGNIDQKSLKSMESIWNDIMKQQESSGATIVTVTEGDGSSGMGDPAGPAPEAMRPNSEPSNTIPAHENNYQKKKLKKAKRAPKNGSGLAGTSETSIRSRTLDDGTLVISEVPESSNVGSRPLDDGVVQEMVPDGKGGWMKRFVSEKEFNERKKGRAVGHQTGSGGNETYH
jgi:hypothetical protein